MIQTEDMIQTIEKRLALLHRSIQAAKKEQKSFPEGRLRVSISGKQKRYYKMTENGNSNGEYLSMKNMDFIRLLAQKDYNEVFLKKANAERKKLEKLLSQYQKLKAETSYENLSDIRKTLVTPYILPDDLIAREWQSKPFKSNPYKPEKKIFATRRGEMVRSKSEAIIADMLYEMGIPYRYEYPVKMCNGEIKYPDFTLLNINTRKIIYFEHFGCMDDEDYRRKTGEKMDLYRASGIYPGKNLMFTYETEDNPLDISGARKMLSEVFLS